MAVVDGTCSDRLQLKDQLVSTAPIQDGFDQWTKLEIEYVATARLVRADRKIRRAHKGQQEALQRNLRRFTQVRPILARRSDGKVIAGHGILEAAIAIGRKEVAVTYIEGLSDEEASVLRISLHKIEELSSWDDATLKVELKHLVEVTPDLTVFTGFSTAEIDVRIQDAGEKTDVADELPAKQAGPAVSRSGDIWLFKGGHRLACGDALSETVLDDLMQGIKARLILSDVPYNVVIKGNVSSRLSAKEFAMASGEMTKAEFTRFLRSAFENVARVTKDGSLALYFIDWRHIEEMMTAGRAVYSDLKNLIVWAKTNAGMGSLWRSQHELIFAWKQGSGPHVNNVVLGKNGRWRSNVWTYAGANAFGRSRNEELAGHVTPKSVSMLHDAILDVTEAGDIVLDPFCGSGSTFVAAHRARRIGFGIEIDPEYVDTAVRRLEKFTKAPARHAVTNKTFEETAAERGLFTSRKPL